MEMSMYQDNDNEKSQQLRKGMHLDFESNKTKQQKFSSMLNNSSDMLKLSSPEDLDKLMSHSHSSVVGTTPTPTSFIYPKYVTDEQEAYARGFVEALAELHQSPAMSSGSQSATTNTASSSSNQVGLSLNTAKPTYSTLMPMSTQSTFVSPYNTAQGTVASSMTMMNPTVSRRHPPFAPSGLAAHNALSQPPHIPPHNMQMPSSHPYAPAVHVKSEPSTSFTDHQVPRSPGGASSRMTESPSAETDEDNYDRVENVNRLDSIPVDLEEQEKIKLERKRARNRIAARKCRTRKLERIGRLEEKVADLKSRNNELAQTANSLSDQVMQLKQQIMEHMKSGCQIMMPDMRPMPTGY